MSELIPVINEIVKYGLEPNVVLTDGYKSLERNLVKLYSLYFEIEYEFDSTEYPDFDRTALPDIRHNISANCKDFGLYQSILDPLNLEKNDNNVIGDAIDDLIDIILDLLQVSGGWKRIVQVMGCGIFNIYFMDIPNSIFLTYFIT